MEICIRVSKSMKRILFQTSLLLFFTAACTTQLTETKSVRNFSIQIITNSNAEPRAVRAAITDLGSITTLATFWSQIANNKHYTIEHRQLCFFQLLRRHAHEGMTLGDLAKRLDRPTWIRAEDVQKILIVAGLMPINVREEGTSFGICVLRPSEGDVPGFWMRIAGTITKEELIALLRGESGGERIAASVIHELVISEVGENPYRLLPPKSKVVSTQSHER